MRKSKILAQISCVLLILFFIVFGDDILDRFNSQGLDAAGFYPVSLFTVSGIIASVTLLLIVSTEKATPARIASVVSACAAMFVFAFVA